MTLFGAGAAAHAKLGLVHIICTHGEPQIPNLKPQTLNPKLQTQNPKQIGRQFNADGSMSYSEMKSVSGIELLHVRQRHNTQPRPTS